MVALRFVWLVCGWFVASFAGFWMVCGWFDWFVAGFKLYS